MIQAAVKRQLDEIYIRVIATGVSVKQHFPRTEVGSIGDLPNTAIALKNIPYADLYKELDNNDQYHIKLPDGGLLMFQYTFERSGSVSTHRLGFFPCPVLPTIEEAPELYDRDELFGDILLKRIVRFPIRFDYDPTRHRPVAHPKSHLTLGQFENCRIPVTRPVSPNHFLLFILKNFYYLLYQRNKNAFDRRPPRCEAIECIDPAERRHIHLSA